MDSCVYWIRCPDHTDMFTQGYIGVSKNAEKRFNQHLKSSGNKRLKFAIQKYGWDNLIKSIVLIAEKDYCLDIEKKLRPLNQIGWNIVSGGGNPPLMIGPQPKLRGRPAWNKGKQLSCETKEKISIAAKKQWQDPDMRAMLSDLKKGKPSPSLGKKRSQETIEKIRAAKIGRPSRKKGKKLTGTALENTIAASMVQWLCPHCLKQGMNIGAGNRWHFDNCKEKADLC